VPFQPEARLTAPGEVQKMNVISPNGAIMKVLSLSYVVIESTDVDRWRDFATEVVGMMLAPGMPDDGNLYLKMDQRPFRFTVQPGNADGLFCCGWELAGEAELEAARQTLASSGLEVEEGSASLCAQRRVAELLRFRDPSGNTLELCRGCELDYEPLVSPVGVPEFVTGFNGGMGLGHAVLPAPKLAETHAFYRELLGFGDSDYMHFRFSDDSADPGQGLHFLHAANPRHHSLALYEAEMPSGCVHLMVEVPHIDDVGYCLDRVLAKGVPITATLGRHSNDQMISFYMATPAGFALEFGCSGLQIDWADFTPTRSVRPSLWGHEFQAPE
jgi:3,4-dihydroxy-9,10-secoandrosta-1,3,5(10)-triene-9,17-dione 4,5-dioxygenase